MLLQPVKAILFGHVFSAAGIAPEPAKVVAFQQLLPPANVQELRSLLGTINFCGRFIPNLADLTHPLRRLAKKDTIWSWGTNEQLAFTKLKEKLSAASSLTYFDGTLKIFLTVDASPVGLGAILSQERHGKQDIVAFASRALTPVEARYSQIERELLAAVWGTEHFHLYLYGTHFQLCTDNKPLVSILQNPRASPSVRLERLALRLSPYTFSATHTRGVNNPSDYLSRHPLKSISSVSRPLHNIQDNVNLIALHCLPHTITLEEVTKATSADGVLQQVIEALKNHAKWTNPALRNFTSIRHQLSVSDQGLLLKEHQLVLPSTLQRRAITLAHTGHQGITKTLSHLKSKVWFPHMNDIVKSSLKSCIPCQATIPTYQRDPIQIPPKPQNPWEALSLDFAGPFPNGKYIMVLIDDTTRFPITHILSSLTTTSVLRRFEETFSIFGTPKEVKTDNGPPFHSTDFKTFNHNLGIKHHRITPYWPQANGEVERFMRTIKRFVQATTVEGRDWTKQLPAFLSAYRATPHSCTEKSPYSMLFGREMNTIVHIPQEINAQTPPPGPPGDTRNRLKMKRYADTRRRTSPHTFNVGDTVLCKRMQTSKTCSIYDPSPYEITSINGTQITAERDGSSVTRNANFFKLLPRRTIIERWNLHGDTSWTGLSNYSQDSGAKRNVPDSSNTPTSAERQLEDSLRQTRPRREPRQPAHLKDFICYETQI